MRRFVLSCFVCSGLFAQSVTSIEFKGLKHISSERAAQIVGIGVSDDLTLEKSNIALKKLYQQGYFQDIKVIYDNGALIFDVLEKPSISKIEFDGVSKSDGKKLLDFIDLKKGDVYDENKARASSDKIKVYFQAKGYFGSVVEHEMKKVNDDAIAVVFKINRGDDITIKNVKLVGAKDVSYSDVESSLTNPSRDFLGFLWGFNDGKLKLNELPSDSGAIKEYYLNKGYLDAKVSDAYLKAYFDDYTADISYFIEEGQRYKVNDVSIDYSEFVKLEGESALKKLPRAKDLQTTKKRYASSWKIRKDVQQISDDVSDFGYAYVNVIPDIVKVSENKVDINFKVYPNEKVYIRNLTIKGNSKTSDKVIRREMYLTEGHLYSKIDFKDSLNALRRTSYFEDVNIKEQRVSSNQIDLIVEVKEASTGSITGGIGYGSSDGLLLNASVNENNIFGSGFSGRFSVDRSDDSLSATISLTNPRVYDSRWFIGNTIYARNHDWDNYDEKNYGYSLDVGRSFLRHFGAGVNYTVEQSKLSDINSMYIKLWYQPKALKSALTPYIYFNNTDDYYLPRSGVYTKFSTEFAGLGGDVDFIKSSFKYTQFFSPYYAYDIDVILRLKLVFDKIWQKGYTPINEKLYLGGVGFLRGYESRSVAPISPYDKDDRIGGSISGLGTVELNFPIVNKLKLRGSLFYDYGMIGEEKIDEIKRSSYGLAIEWTTPMGPLQFVFARPIDNKPHDKVSRFEFTIGNRF